MRTDHNYQPEDIEALLAEKAFNELYEEERAFVLGHLSSAGEYERMREMLLAIRGGAGGEDTAGTLGPSGRVKRELLEEFGREQRRRRVLWWNSVGLWFRDNLRLDLAVVRVGFAAVLLVLAVWLGFRLAGGEPAPVIAKNTDPPAPQQVVPAPSPGATAVAPGSQDVKKDDNVALPPAQDVYPDDVVVTDHQPVLIADGGNPQRTNITEVSPQTGAVVPTNGTVVPANPDTQLLALHPIAVSHIDSSSSTLCSGANVALTATGGTTFNWTPVTSATAPATMVSPGNITITNYSVTNYSPSSSWNYVTVQPAADRSRSLAANAQLIPFFFELK